MSTLTAVVLIAIMVHSLSAEMVQKTPWLSYDAFSAVLVAFYVASFLSGLLGGATALTMLRWREFLNRGKGTVTISLAGISLSALVLLVLAATWR